VTDDMISMLIRQKWEIFMDDDDPKAAFRRGCPCGGVGLAVGCPYCGKVYR
jgi:hypothetical protein